MGRGRDLTSNESTIVAMNIRRFWNYEKKLINHGKVKDIIKVVCGIRCNLWKNWCQGYFSRNETSGRIQ
jgi:hypothetical protein